ncbi:methyltransferase domain-containing protein [Aspergillus coremiiformis]|uniref:Methyltransferase domain-containing protein n=1 Tax=Aspergillus coremiiformis TaxID=138285 RepID=A0A5N6YV60_9EURO|nr:methyltransferase domain-containing protein [Aspergillus coremiiformis]
MLPTPSTSHVTFDTIYEPSEDTYLFLDTLSSAPESAWLTQRFKTTASPLVVEIGTGSGVVLGFVAANSLEIFGRRDILPLGIDVNRNACTATRETVHQAIHDRQTETEAERQAQPNTVYLGSVVADLGSALRVGCVDVLLFNPPYVPSEELPRLPEVTDEETGLSRSERFERDSYLLSLTYAGGRDGMETTDRLLEAIPRLLDPGRGVAYVLFCAQNRPQEVKERIRAWGEGWRAESVGNSGVQAGWEKLVIVRIWRDSL